VGRIRDRITRGRPGWRWVHRSRYVGAACWVLIGLARIAAGSLPRWIAGAAVLAGGIAFAVATVRVGVRHRRSGCEGPRGVLLALARERAGVEGVWLNRDEHVAFSVTTGGRGPLRRWHVARIDEDQILDYQSVTAGGRLAMTADAFTVMAFLPEVLREPVGTVLTAGDDLEPVLAEEPRRSRRQRAVDIWRRLQAERTGHLYASAEEIAEVAAQLEAAELIAPDER
jgi:hypothetical protein